MLTYKDYEFNNVKYTIFEKTNIGEYKILKDN